MDEGNNGLVFRNFPIIYFFMLVRIVQYIFTMALCSWLERP